MLELRVINGQNKPRYSKLIWLAYCLSLVIFSSGLSWQLHKSANFFYGFWYQSLSIAQVIENYAPKNSQGKQDFGQTNFNQHQQSFAEIVTAIHQHGAELANLTYTNQDKQKRTLLTAAEVIHLRDVSVLIDIITDIFWINLLILFLLSFYLYRKKTLAPNRNEKIFMLLIPFMLGVILLAFFGFTEVFYYLHTLVFPDNHQWFFYYQESLMSSLMKAPDLFAAIAATLVLLAVLFFTLFYRLLMVRIFVEPKTERGTT